MTREQEARMYELLTLQTQKNITPEQVTELKELIELDNIPEEIDDEDDEDECEE